MKAKLILASLLVSAQTLVFAQKCSNLTTIELDFKSKHLSSNVFNEWAVRKGGLYQVKVTGINLNLYKVQIEKEDSTIVSDVSIPTFEVFGLESINEVIAGISKSTSAAQSLALEKAQLTQQLAQLDSDKDAKLEEIKQLEVLKGIRNEELKMIETNKLIYGTEIYKQNLEKGRNEIFQLDTKIMKVNGEIKLIEGQILEIEKEINRIDREIAMAKADPNESILIKFNDFNNSINIILSEARDGVLKDLDNFTFERSLQPLYYLVEDGTQKVPEEIGKTSIADIVRKSDQLRETIIAYQGRIEEIKDKYEAYINTPEVARLLEKDKEDPKVSKKSNEVMATLTDAEKVFDDALGSISKEKMAVYLKDLVNLVNNSCTTYTSLPLQQNGDINKLRLTITPRKEEYGLQTYHAEYLFPKKTGYAGVGISFYYSGMTDDVYSVLETPTSDSTSKFQIVNEDPGKGEVGIAALLHYGCKLPNDWLGIHGTIGPAISIDTKVKPRLAVGAGLGFGKTRNLITLNFLLMAGYENKLSGVYSENTDYSVKPENITVSKLAASWGISLGYIYKF